MTATVDSVAREQSSWRGSSQTMVWNISLSWLWGSLSQFAELPRTFNKMQVPSLQVEAMIKQILHRVQDL